MNKGYTALHEACNRGHTSVARLLVNSGAEVNIFGGTDDQKETPLHDAARNGHYEVRYPLKLFYLASSQSITYLRLNLPPVVSFSAVVAVRSSGVIPSAPLFLTKLLTWLRLACVCWVESP